MPAGNSATLGGFVSETVKRQRRPGTFEGRIASDPDSNGRVMVTVRALTGDAQRLGPLAGADPKATAVPARQPTRGDRCWVSTDETGDPACVVAWEPR